MASISHVVSGLSPNSKKIGVVGCGVVGKSLMKTIALQPDMKLVGVCDMVPSLTLRFATNQGYEIPVYARNAHAVKAMESAGMRVAGVFEDFLREVDLVCDASSPGQGKQNADLYDKFDKPVIFQGGENPSIADISFGGYPTYHKTFGKKRIRVLPCNSLALARIIYTLSKHWEVKSIIASIVSGMDRLKTKDLPLGAISPRSTPSHHAVELGVIFPAVNCVTSVVNVSAIQGHVNSVSLTLGVAVQREDILKVFESDHRIKVFCLNDGWTSTAHINEFLEQESPQFDMMKVGIWDETIYISDNVVHWLQYVPHEAIVAPETVDAIRAALKLESDGAAAAKITNCSLEKSNTKSYKEREELQVFCDE